MENIIWDRCFNWSFNENLQHNICIMTRKSLLPSDVSESDNQELNAPASEEKCQVEITQKLDAMANIIGLRFTCPWAG